jgi:hypothetical protein
MNAKFTAYCAETGRVMYGGTAYDPASIATPKMLILLDEAFTDGWLEGGEHHSQPEQTSEAHTFDWVTKQWADLRTPQDLLDAVRRKRTALLLASDWTQLPDVPVATREAWAAYRQALRDITGQDDMREVIWPVGPKAD